nr:retrotransposon protein, putative, unclassified [Tanacetum cinerariifolium]
MRPFGCLVIILNTLDPLGKFDGKAGNQSNGSSGKARVETIPDKDYILLSLWTQDPLFFSSSKDSPSDGFKPSGEEEIKDAEDLGNEDNKVLSTMEPRVYQEKDDNVNITNNINTVSLTANAASTQDNAIYENIVYGCADDLNMPNVEEIVNSNDNEYVCTQEEGIDYDEVFALVARIDAIRLFLAYASFKDFVVYQMDMKSAFLYDKIEEEVYVCQPPGFEDPELPNRVYKVEKALYGLHQALRAWSTRKEMCTEFKKMMHKKFQMSSIRELTFFLGLQTASIPMETSKPLMKDENAKDVDVHFYTSMIGTWMYLTFSRPDIMFTEKIDFMAMQEAKFSCKLYY